MTNTFLLLAKYHVIVFAVIISLLANSCTSIWARFFSETPQHITEGTITQTIIAAFRSFVALLRSNRATSDLNYTTHFLIIVMAVFIAIITEVFTSIMVACDLGLVIHFVWIAEWTLYIATIFTSSPASTNASIRACDSLLFT